MSDRCSTVSYVGRMGLDLLTMLHMLCCAVLCYVKSTALTVLIIDFKEQPWITMKCELHTTTPYVSCIRKYLLLMLLAPLGALYVTIPNSIPTFQFSVTPLPQYHWNCPYIVQHNLLTNATFATQTTQKQIKSTNKQCRDNFYKVWLYIVYWKYCPFDIWQCMHAVAYYSQVNE